MGLYNNYYFFCKSIPLSGIFIHLNLYNIMKRTIKTIFLALCYSAVTNGQTSTQYIYRPYSRTTWYSNRKYCSIGMGEASTTVKLVGSWMPNDTISTSVDDCGRWRTKNSYLWARRSVHPANIHRQQKRKQNNTERYPIGRSMVM